MGGSALPRLRSDSAPLLIAAGASAFLLLLVACAIKFGLAGLALPLLGLIAIVLLARPGFTLTLAVVLAVLAEDADFSLFPQTAKLYTNLLKGFTPLDAVVAVALIGLVARIVSRQQPVRLPPRPLLLTLVLVGGGLVSGLLVGREAGSGITGMLLVIHTFVYVMLVPLMIVNLDIRERDVTRLLAAAVALAAVKAVIGLAAAAHGGGAVVNNETALTYYAPTANWIMTVALLGIAAALITRAGAPRWAIVAAPLILLCLVLSYRRSFWIADAIGALLVLLLGVAASRGGRRLVVPVIAVLGVGIYLLGNVALQSDTPIAQRVQSLSPTKVATTPDDRYRLDERANVLHALREQPIAGLGLEQPWHATVRSLPVEVNPDHLYVHFAALYWWLKLGILGLLAYVGLILSGAWLSIRVWTRSRTPVVKAFGLGSLCSFVGLIAIETTATFTGADLRFTLVLVAQLGLLAAIAQQPREPEAIDQAEAESSALTSVV